MLKFDRKEFCSGLQKVKEPETVDGVVSIKEYYFKPSDKGKDFAFLDESYVLNRYAHLFTLVV